MTVLTIDFQDRGFPTPACSLLPPDSDDVRLSPPAPAPWEPRARVSEREPRLSGSPWAREWEPGLSGSPGTRDDCLREPGLKEVRRCSDTAK